MCFPIPIMGASLIPWMYRGTQSGSFTSRAVMILCFPVPVFSSCLRTWLAPLYISFSVERFCCADALKNCSIAEPCNAFITGWCGAQRNTSQVQKNVIHNFQFLISFSIVKNLHRLSIILHHFQ